MYILHKNKCAVNDEILNNKRVPMRCNKVDIL